MSARPLLLCCILCAAFPAAAQQEDWPNNPDAFRGLYLGGNFGRAEAKGGCAQVARLAGVGVSTCDETDDYLKFLIGLPLLPFIDAELSYHNFGAGRGTGTYLGVPSKAKARASGATLRALAHFDFEPFSIQGALGMIRWETETSATTNAGTVLLDAKDNGFSLHWGFGIAANLTKEWTLRLEHERFEDIGNPDTTGRADVSTTSLGLLYRF